MTVDNSLVAFFDLALLEELTERALHRWATRKQQKTRGGHVESMDDQGIQVHRLQARDRAVLQFGRTPGNGGKSCWFVDHDQIRVCKHNKQILAIRALTTWVLFQIQAICQGLGTSRSRCASCGKPCHQRPATTMDPIPPTITDPTGPMAAAIAPDSNSPS